MMDTGDADLSMEHHMDGQTVGIFDPNFEPQFRSRSNTWPLRPREDIKEERVSPPVSVGLDTTPETNEDFASGTSSGSGLKAKSSSRRNAWGNLSYADLITKAIESTVDKRLTLSQIYDWMVQNVPYFKDKGDTNSSAGWKNSIRHNLSLHSRFMRIQNEGTGKSSWWVINPDAKPGKSPRRRATSMDTKAYEKKRSRVKKKLDQLRALGVSSSPKGSDYGDGDHGFDPFSLSPQDFRARTSSNASSLGGRLSPIQSMYEPDLHDRQVPPMSPISWNQTSNYSGESFPETLSESLADMFVGDTLSPCGGGDEMSNRTLSTPSPLSSKSSPGYLQPPPPYIDTRQQNIQISPNQNYNDSGMLQQGKGGNLAGMAGGMNYQDVFLEDPVMSASLNDLFMDSSSEQSTDQSSYNSGYNGASLGDMMVSTGVGNNIMDQNESLLRQALTEKQQLVRSQIQAALQNQHQRQLLQARLKELQQQQIRRQMQQRLQMQIQQQQMREFQQQVQQRHRQYQSIPVHQTTANRQAQQMDKSTTGEMSGTSLRNNQEFLPNDLDLVTITESSEDLDCNVDEIINQELSFDGLLDFSFDTGTNNNIDDVLHT